MSKNKKELYVKGFSEKGIVKKILAEKRYGFIAVKDHNDAIFYFDNPNNLSFREKDIVEFIAKDGGEKTIAIKIKKVANTNTSIGNESSNNENNSMNKIYLPKDTTKKLVDIIRTNSNYSLKVNKFVSFDNDDKAKIEQPDNNIINLSELKKINNKHKKSIIRLPLSAHGNFQVGTSWRMVLGLGVESVYETSMTLHHIYGIPYIPGQALKGIARSWFINNNIPDSFNFEQQKANDKLEEEIIKNSKEFRDLFGNPKVGNIGEQSGKVIFFDAFPIDTPIIKKDIMTPHYGEYYGDTTNNKPPADYYNPVPIPFLTVENTTFEFFVGVKPSVENGEELLDKAVELLKNALKNHGVGAKTAVGYGYFG